MDNCGIKDRIESLAKTGNITPMTSLTCHIQQSFQENWTSLSWLLPLEALPKGCLLRLWKYYYICRALRIQGCEWCCYYEKPVHNLMRDTWVSDKKDPISLLPASLSDLQTDRHSFFCTPGSQLCGDSASLKKRRGEDWSKMKQGCVSSCAVCALNKGIRIKGHYLHCRRHRITLLFWSFSSREEYLILIKIFI